MLLAAPLVIVSPVMPHNSPHLVNVCLLARMELSLPPALVLRVTLIAPVAPDLLSMNVQNASRRVLFSHMDVAYQHVSDHSSLTRPVRRARIATRVAQAVLVLALLIVWHVRTVLNFCVLDHVYLPIALDHRMLFLAWEFVFLIWCKFQIPQPQPQLQIRLRLHQHRYLLVARPNPPLNTDGWRGGRFCLWYSELPSSLRWLLWFGEDT